MKSHSPTAGPSRPGTSRPSLSPAVRLAGEAYRLPANSIGGRHEHDA